MKPTSQKTGKPWNSEEKFAFQNEFKEQVRLVLRSKPEFILTERVVGLFWKRLCGRDS